MILWKTRQKSTCTFIGDNSSESRSGTVPRKRSLAMRTLGRRHLGDWLRIEAEGNLHTSDGGSRKEQDLTIVHETHRRGPTKGPAGPTLRWELVRPYNNTINIGQLKCATDGGMVAGCATSPASTSGSIALNITKAPAPI